MKLILYNSSIPIVFSSCDDVLKQMDYHIRHSDFKRGIISAFKGEKFSSLSSVIDLQFTAEKFSVGIAVISSTMSNIFGNIYYDPVSEQQFIENLFFKLEAKEIGNPFKMPEKNFVEAIAS